MSSHHLLAIVVLLPLAWHVGLTAFVYYDTGRLPLDRRRWTLIAGLIPLFGFLAYVFERGELDYDPAEDPYAGGGLNVHPSRADDVSIFKSAEETDSEGNSDGDDGE